MTCNSFALSRLQKHKLCCLILLGLLLSGCGGSAYRNRMNARFAKLEEEESARPKVKLNMLYDYILEAQLPGEKRFNLRVPRCFSTNEKMFHELTLDNTQKPFLPNRVWPLGISPPGYYWTYEATIEEGATRPSANEGKSDQTRWSYSFCFGALQLSEEEELAELQGFLAQLNQALQTVSGANPAQIDIPQFMDAEPISIVNLQGETRYWKKIHLEGDFFFTSVKGRIEDTWERKPGVIEIYLSSQNRHLVILEGQWRKDQAEATLMPYFMPLVASTVTIKDAATQPPVE